MFYIHFSFLFITYMPLTSIILDTQVLLFFFINVLTMLLPCLEHMLTMNFTYILHEMVRFSTGSELDSSNTSDNVKYLKDALHEILLSQLGPFSITSLM